MYNTNIGKTVFYQLNEDTVLPAVFIAENKDKTVCIAVFTGNINQLGSGNLHRLNLIQFDPYGAPKTFRFTLEPEIKPAEILKESE